MEPVRIAFLVYPDVTQLDLTGPAQVLSRLGDQSLDLVWKSREPVPTDCGFALLPTATFDELREADILCIPGGLGCIDVMEDDEALEWVRTVGAEAQWVTSVCTGSLILGAAGLLQGYRAACHWDWREHLEQFGAQPVAQRVVFDRNRVTGGGVTADIDFALALTAAIRGEEHARAVQLGLEYGRRFSGQADPGAPRAVRAGRGRGARDRQCCDLLPRRPRDHGQRDHLDFIPAFGAAGSAGAGGGGIGGGAR